MSEEELRELRKMLLDFSARWVITDYELIQRLNALIARIDGLLAQLQKPGKALATTPSASSASPPAAGGTA